MTQTFITAYASRAPQGRWFFLEPVKHVTEGSLFG